MSGNWKTKQLGDICDIQLGKTPSRKNKQLWDEDKITENVWLSVADLKNTDGKFVHDSKEYVSFEGKGFCKPVKQGTLLVSFKLTLGRLAIAGRELYTNEAIAALSINDEMMISREYLYYYLHYFDWDAVAVGKEKVKGKTLNKAILKTLEIRFPPLGEQQRIVSILDEAFDQLSKSLEKIEKKVNDADEYYDCHISTLFNKLILEYDSKTLNDCCSEITVGYVGAMKSKYKENGIPFLRSKNVRPFSIVEDGITFIDETFNNSLSKSMLKPGDLVIVRTGYPGTAAVIPETMRVANCSDMVIVRTGPEVDPNYLAMFFNSSIGKKMVASNLVGAAQQHFNVGAAKKTKLPLPPIQTQQNIVTESNLVRSLAKEIKSVNMENLNNIAELEQSILQEAFSGKLTGGHPA